MRQRFFGNLWSRLAFYGLVVMFFIALGAPYLANDQPLCVTYKGHTWYPAFSTTWFAKTILGVKPIDTIQTEQGREIIQFDITDWRKMQTSYILWPLVPFSPDKPDYYNRDFTSPTDSQLQPLPDGTTREATFKFRHHLGTDNLGRDVLAGIIHGTRITLLVGIFAMGIATILGLLCGVFSGYFGDDRLKLSRITVIMFFPSVVIAWFYAFIALSSYTAEAFEQNTWKGLIHVAFSLVVFIVIPLSILYPLNKISKGWMGKKIPLPVDAYLSRSTEVFNALPKLLLIISIAAVIEQRSTWLVVLTIGFTSWTEIARYTRAELLRIRDLGYIEAMKAAGMKSRRIIRRHALPNAMSSVFVVVTFGIASAVLVESGLSFLGIGVPEEAVTWGSMLNKGRMEMEAWWLVVFPGLAIFFTVMIFNLIGEGLRDALDPHIRKL